MYKSSIWEINGLQKEFSKTIKTSTSEKDDEDDGEGAKVLVPN